MPWVLWGVVAALLLRELMPAAISRWTGAGQAASSAGPQALARPQCCSGKYAGAKGPVPFPCAVWETWSTGEEDLTFFSVQSCSPQREWRRGSLMCHCLMCSILTDSSFSAAGEPSSLRFSFLSFTCVWRSLCHATWSYILVACFVSWILIFCSFLCHWSIFGFDKFPVVAVVCSALSRLILALPLYYLSI